jgi:hypothetical protein
MFTQNLPEMADSRLGRMARRNAMAPSGQFNTEMRALVTCQPEPIETFIGEVYCFLIKQSDLIMTIPFLEEMHNRSVKSGDSSTSLERL